MTTKNLLFPALVTVLISTLPAGGSAAAQPIAKHDNNVKTAVLDGYLQHCVAVLSSKGYRAAAIKAECKCELDQIDQHFDIFEQMLAGDANNQRQINDFKKQLLDCKVKTAVSL